MDVRVPYYIFSGMCKKRDMLWFGGTDIFGLDSVMPKSG